MRTLSSAAGQDLRRQLLSWPGIVLGGPDSMRDLLIRMRILRDGEAVYEDEVSTSRMKRPFEELADYLGKEPHSRPGPS